MRFFRVRNAFLSDFPHDAVFYFFLVMCGSCSVTRRVTLQDFTQSAGYDMVKE